MDSPSTDRTPDAERAPLVGLWRIAPPFPRRDAGEALGAWLGRLVAWLTATRPLRATQHLVDSGGPVLAAGLGYMALFSFFAALWVMFSALGLVLVGNEHLLDRLVAWLGDAVPGLFGEDGGVEPRSVLSTAAFGWTGAAALAGALWTATGWMNGARISVRTIFEVPVQTGRNLVATKLRDVLLIAVFGLLLLLSAGLSLLPRLLVVALLDAFGLGGDARLAAGLAQFGGFLVSLLVDTVITAVILRVLASLRVPRPVLLQGAVLGALLIGAVKQLGSALLGGASSNPLLASFAVILGVLIFFQLNCMVLLLAASWVKVTMDDLGASPRLLTAEEAEREAVESETRARRERLAVEAIRLRERINRTSRFTRGRRALLRRLAAVEDEQALLEHEERRRRLNLDRIEGEAEREDSDRR